MNKTIIENNISLQRDIFCCPEKNPFNCTEELLLVLKDAFEKKLPFSMIRLGDGEGRILGYPDTFADEIYLNQVLTYQFGAQVLNVLKTEFSDNFVDKAMNQLKGFITEAIKNADVLGAPSWLHFRAPIEASNIIPLTAQSVCLDYAARLKTTSQVYDHFIFKPFHKNGLFDRLLEGVEHLNIVSHTDMSEKLISRFKLKTCTHIAIPGHQSFMQSALFHYPIEYKNILNKLSVVTPGDIYFVAAGYLGKLYCNYIKQHGGIAIDIGSIFDGWCGVGRKDAIQNKDHRI